MYWDVLRHGIAEFNSNLWFLAESEHSIFRYLLVHALQSTDCCSPWDETLLHLSKLQAD